MVDLMHCGVVQEQNNEYTCMIVSRASPTSRWAGGRRRPTTVRAATPVYMIVWWNLSGLLVGFFYDTPARDMIVGSRAKDSDPSAFRLNDGLFSEHLYLAHVDVGWQRRYIWMLYRTLITAMTSLE